MQLVQLTGELARKGAFPAEWRHVWGEQGNSQLGLWGPSSLRDMKAAHGIAGLRRQVGSFGGRDQIDKG